MNKNQGILAGAVLAVALLLRPFGSTAPATGDTAKALEAGAGGESGGTNRAGVSKEGPWLASCNYWAPVTQPENGIDQSPEDAEKNSNIASAIRDSYTPPAESGCGTGPKSNWAVDRWGFPTVEPAQKDNADQNRGVAQAQFDPFVNVTAVIATVPDPVHAHLAMQFDRALDVLLQAAADNRYVSSSYWLPWQRRATSLKGAEGAGDMEPGHDPERESQPGLIVLKHVPDSQPPTCEDPAPASSFYRVIYVFLVAETPTKGVDGSQLQNALQYEEQLRGLLGENFSSGPPEDTTIIGPGYTGSAASMRAALDFARKNNSKLHFLVAGTTTTRLSIDQLSTTTELAEKKNGNEKPEVDYYSFASDSSFTQEEFLWRLYWAKYDPRRVALLIEDNTAFGSVYSGTFKSQAEVKSPTRRNKAEKMSPVDLFAQWRKQILTIRFPREISLLRNAEVEGNQPPAGDASQGNVPSPYLHFSVKDLSAQDAAPQFSRENTPLSQESQLMAIAHQMDLKRIQFVQIEASNSLDSIFLASFLHRAYPDAQLVLGTDLLMTRGVDNSPFIGSITYGPSHLMGIRGGSAAARVYTDSTSLTEYNAAAFVFHQTVPPIQVKQRQDSDSPCVIASDPPTLQLKNYLQLQSPIPDPKPGEPLQAPKPGEPLQAPIWATTVGRDAYYPLGLLNFKSSQVSRAMPIVDPYGTVLEPEVLTKQDHELVKNYLGGIRRSALINPALGWTVLCCLIIVMCVAHIVLMSVANYWSPLTRDLAVNQNDEPYRRATCIHISTAALVLMAWVVACPAVCARINVQTAWEALVWAGAVLLAAAAAAFTTVLKTRWNEDSLRCLRSKNETPTEASILDWRRRGCYCQILLTWIMSIAWIWEWFVVCREDYGNHAAYLTGISFSFRCFYPLSGVSPILPMLFLLLGWYLWGLFATWRLRFSETGRPHLAAIIPGESRDLLAIADEGRYMVFDNDLKGCTQRRGVALFEQIEKRFFALCVMTRFFKSDSKFLNLLLLSLLAALGLACCIWCPFHSFDHFLWYSSWWRSSTSYEFLVSLLLFPLLFVCLTGWLRLLSVWIALQSGLLSRLEDQPIRFAFSRLNGMGWMTMLRRVSWLDQWRDMDRCVESMCQILHYLNQKPKEGNEDESVVADSSKSEAGTSRKWGISAKIRTKFGEAKAEAKTSIKKIHRDSDTDHGRNKEYVAVLEKLRIDIVANHDKLRKLRSGDHGNEDKMRSCALMKQVDLQLAEFAQRLFQHLLIPYWKCERVGLVESESVDDIPIRAKRTEAAGSHPQIPMELRAGPASNDPAEIILAEEFVAIRYMSLIRAVLANMRYLMTFVSIAFVLTILAWNSYPFQPREIVDWLFTGALIVLGIGVIRVFAQMHRDPILSRATDTKPNELGWDFYFRILAYGAVPVITWLAYEFPDIGSTIYKFVLPGASVFK
jgi:hypothetical protein